MCLRPPNVVASKIPASVNFSSSRCTAPKRRPPRRPRAPTQLLRTFATLEEVERHFREAEEGEWAGDTLRRFVQDIMMHDSESGTWRFPYTPARLHRLRAFIASPASDYDLFAKAKTVRCPMLVFRGGMSKRFPLIAEQPFLQAFASEPKLVVCPRSGIFPNRDRTRHRCRRVEAIPRPRALKWPAPIMASREGHPWIV